MLRLGAVFAALLLASCVTNKSYDDLVGSGRLDLRQSAWTFFQKYRAEQNPAYFVLNPETGRANYNFCAEIQCANSDAMRDAIATCEKRTGGACKVFASDKRIVWRGPVFVGGRPVEGSKDDPVLAASPPGGPGGVPARFRILDGAGSANWIEGRLWTVGQRGRHAFTAEFADGLECAGYFDVPEAGAGAPKPIEGIAEGSCRPTSGAPFDFNGRLEGARALQGEFAGVDSLGRRFEATYGQ